MEYPNAATIQKRLEVVEQELTAGAANPAKNAELSREHKHLQETLTLLNDHDALMARIRETELLAGTEQNQEMRDLADFELKELETKKNALERTLAATLTPSDPRDGKNVILEIRAGAGGDEAGLFAAELLRMYTRYAESKKWKMRILSENRNDQGGYKEVTASVEGEEVYGTLKYEQGVHRVQRVPDTEKQGRIHTSTATVAAMPEIKERETTIDPKDLRVDIYRAGGHGGQNVNKVETAVRITHLPTGMVVACQDERFQQQNRERAMQILRARLAEQEAEKLHAQESAQRKEQIGGGGRSEKIRTYNYPQSRITDHRVGKNFSNLEGILNGNLDEIIDELKANRAS